MRTSTRRVLLVTLWLARRAEAAPQRRVRGGALPPPPSRAWRAPRGGAADAASAWSAGSKYDYGRTSPHTSSSPRSLSSSPRTVPSPSYDRVQDDAGDTKEAFAEAFLQRDDRNRFIARVYAILTGQLLFTAGTIHAFHVNPSIRNWMFLHPTGRKVPLLGLLVSTITWFVMLSSEHLRRTSRLKWPLLAAFTVGHAVAVGFIASVYAYASVIKAMGLTAATTLAVTVYTLLQKNPKYDLSQWGRALAGMGLAFLLYGMVHVLTLFGVIPQGFMPYSEAIYSVLGAGLFSLYLAHHTRLIVSGKSTKYQMNEEDYILGAMSVYSDVVNIFLYLLRLLGEMDDRG